MREILVDELKKIQLDILESIHFFCEEHGLSYGLAYGTLLGAVRHNGYIPWDDDIDILMPRNDYNKFLDSFNCSIDNLVVTSPEITSNYYAPYANVYDIRTELRESTTKHRGNNIGVKIDIFPIDGVPDDTEQYKSIMKMSLLYNDILTAKRMRFFTVCNVKRYIYNLYLNLRYFYISYSAIQRKLLNLSGQFENSKYVDHLMFPVYPYRRFERKSIMSFVPRKFEDHYFMCPVGYDNYLKTIYGDYMQLPPVEKRVPHHGFTAYWKD